MSTLIAKRYLVLLPIIAAAVVLWVFTSGSVFGVGHGGSLGVLVLTGSDADTFHGNAAYATDIRDHLKQGSALPVLVLGDAAATAAYSASVGGVGIVTTASLVGVNLNNYAGLYLLSASSSGTGCCNADVARIVGFEAAINAFLNSGGSFGVQDYTGQAALDPILGTVGGANGSVYGFLGGLGGAVDYDNEAVTAAGLAAGFTNYPSLGAWGHQGFDMTFFSGLLDAHTGNPIEWRGKPLERPSSLA